MPSPTAAVEPLLGSSMRVLRNITPLQDFIAAWPLLKQKSLTSPPTLTESERRLFLDLPPEDLEASNIRAATTLSREQLIEKAISSQESLTQEEILILKSHFWTPRTKEESQLYRDAMLASSPEGKQEFYDGWELELCYEKDAVRHGFMEEGRRRSAAARQALRAKANLVLPDAKEWIQHLYQEDKTHWGFICLYDAAIQKLEEERLDLFECTKDGFFRHALMYNGSKDIINTNDNDYPDGAILRKAFHEILKDPEEYQKREDVTPAITYSGHFKDGIAKAGFLTNTFLLIDPICAESIVDDGLQPAQVRWDNMRALAFEADFPVPGREYEEGYQGYTWVRMDQLIYNFYELRLMKADEIGMDKIWKAAQKSTHQAFVSMDPEEASMHTTSCGLSGFTHDSVIGRRFYALRDARERNLPTLP